MIIRIALLIAFAFMAQFASAYPLPKGPKSLQILPFNFTTGFDFEGIVELSNCSGSFIRLETSRDTDRALVLTNGHCLETGFPRPNQIVVGKQSSRRFTLLNSSAQSAGTVRADMIVYAAMTKTDMAIYRLTETYEQIQTRTGIRPLMLSSRRPERSQPIEIISGYWRRGYACAIDGFAYKLQEANYVCEDSMRYTQPGCETIGGTSGSPVVATGSRAVVGVNNTGNEDGGRCTMNNPCEIDEAGNVTYQQGHSYGQQTYWFYSCLTDLNELDLNKPGCQLFK